MRKHRLLNDRPFPFSSLPPNQEAAPDWGAASKPNNLFSSGKGDSRRLAPRDWLPSGRQYLSSLYVADSLRSFRRPIGPLQCHQAFLNPDGRGLVRVGRRVGERFRARSERTIVRDASREVLSTPYTARYHKHTLVTSEPYLRI